MHTDLGNNDLWRASQAGQRGASDSLVARYRPWANSVADRIHRRVAGLQVPREDLRQSAMVGLLEALARVGLADRAGESRPTIRRAQ